MKKIPFGSIGLDEVVYLLWFTIAVAIACFSRSDAARVGTISGSVIGRMKNRINC